MRPPRLKLHRAAVKERIVSTRATRKKSERSRHPATVAQHPLRIVPLHTAPRVASTTSPHSTYRDGPLLNKVEVFTIFWGEAWQDPDHSSLVSHMNIFFDFILTSKLVDQLGEYSVPGKSIGHGSRTGSI